MSFKLVAAKFVNICFSFHDHISNIIIFEIKKKDMVVLVHENRDK